MGEERRGERDESSWGMKDAQELHDNLTHDLRSY
jgi:hypothetical protein